MSKLSCSFNFDTARNYDESTKGRVEGEFAGLVTPTMGQSEGRDMQCVTPLRLNVIYLVYFTLIMPHILSTHTHRHAHTHAHARAQKKGVREGRGRGRDTLGHSCNAFRRQVARKNYVAREMLQQIRCSNV